MEVVIVAAAADAAPRGVAYGLLDVQRVLKGGIVGFILAVLRTYQMLIIASHFEGVCCGNIQLSVESISVKSKTLARARRRYKGVE